MNTTTKTESTPILKDVVLKLNEVITHLNEIKAERDQRMGQSTSNSPSETIKLLEI